MTVTVTHDRDRDTWPWPWYMTVAVDVTVLLKLEEKNRWSVIAGRSPMMSLPGVCASCSGPRLQVDRGTLFKSLWKLGLRLMRHIRCVTRTLLHTLRLSCEIMGQRFRRRRLLIQKHSLFKSLVASRGPWVTVTEPPSPWSPGSEPPWPRSPSKSFHHHSGPTAAVLTLWNTEARAREVRTLSSGSLEQATSASSIPWAGQGRHSVGHTPASWIQ